MQPQLRLGSALSCVIVSLKKSPAYGGEPKRPRIWSFLAELFRMALLI
jgi:hypothetical protein